MVSGTFTHVMVPPRDLAFAILQGGPISYAFYAPSLSQCLQHSRPQASLLESRQAKVFLFLKERTARISSSLVNGSISSTMSPTVLLRPCRVGNVHLRLFPYNQLYT